MNKIFYLVLYLIAIIVRLASLLVIIKFPLIGWLLIFIVDSADYLFALRSGLNFKQYQNIDKSLDLLNDFYLIIAAIVNHFAYVNIYFFLFFFRVIGELIYFKTRKEIFLVFFPNVIEYFFPLQILFSWSLPGLLLGALVLKMPHEWLVHIAHWDPGNRDYVKKHPEFGVKLKK